MKHHSPIADPRVVKALAHPLRVQILGVLEQRTASPNEIARELGADLGVVSYHVRKLRSFGLIKLVKKTPRRGAIEHYYRAKPRVQITDEGWAQTPEIVKGAMVGATVAQVGAAVNAAASAEGFNRSDAHLSRTPLELDERGWTQAAKLLAKTLEQIDRIRAESADRVQTTKEHPVRATAVLMLFESSPAVGPAAQPRRRRSRRAPRAGA